MFISSTAFLVQSSDGRVVILAYRGTEPVNFINWLTDADVHPDKIAIPFETPPGTFEVHGGFYRNVRATRYEVVTALQRAVEGQSILESTEPGQPPASPLEALYITGHSLGGAMSALLAVMLMTEPAYASIASKLRAVYTFGQPMIGTPELAAACDGDPDLRNKVIRYVYRQDVVPHLRPGTPAGSPTSGANTGTTTPGPGTAAPGPRRNSGTPRKSSRRPSRPSHASSRYCATFPSVTNLTTISPTATCPRSPRPECPPSSVTTTSRRNDELTTRPPLGPHLCMVTIVAMSLERLLFAFA
jgi:hypothetical protein